MITLATIDDLPTSCLHSMKLGGYFVNLSTACKVSQHLNIDVRGLVMSSIYRTCSYVKWAFFFFFFGGGVMVVLHKLWLGANLELELSWPRY